MNKFTVVFASDPGYLVHLTVTVKSLLDNNLSSFISINVITGDSKDPRWKILMGVVSGFRNAKLFIHNVDDKDISILKTNYHFKVSNYYRLFCESLINEDKVLYLDADIIVKQDISDLFNIDLDGYFLAAVENPGFDRHESLKMNYKSRYFNSGVMLINLSLWREKGIFSKVVDFVSAYPNAVQFVDQCGLNAVVDGKWLELEAKYNQQSVFFEGEKTYFTCFTADDLKNAIDEPAIIHYTGSSKPWHLCNKHPYKKEYWKYRQLTPFRSFFHDDFSVLNLIKCYTPSFLKPR